MAWERDVFAVLDDLEGEAEGAFARERAPEVADRTRAEYQQVTLASRLMASLGADVGLGVRGVGAVEGRLDRMGTGWCLVSGGTGDWLVPTDAVDAVRGASARSLPELAWSPLTRLGLASALRRVADDGGPCAVYLTDGQQHDGVVLRVGRDFVEVAEGEGDPQRLRLVALRALAAVRSR